LGTVIVAALAYMVFRFFSLSGDSGIDDPAVAVADKFLKAVDNLDISTCRTVSSMSDKLFDRFIEDRKSLGGLIQRRVKTKEQLRNNDWTGCRIVFQSSFANAKDISEQVYLADNKKSLNVYKAEYTYRNPPALRNWKKYEGFDTEGFRKAVEVCVGNFDAGNYKYFEFVSRKFFGAANQQYINRLKEFVVKYGKPQKRTLLANVRFIKEIPGNTSLTVLLVSNKTIYNYKGKQLTAWENIILIKDVDQADAKWDVCTFNPGRPREPQPPKKPTKKK